LLRLVAPHSVTTEAALPTDEERRHPARADQRYVAATRLLRATAGLTCSTTQSCFRLTTSLELGHECPTDERGYRQHRRRPNTADPGRSGRSGFRGVQV
jgi:hypothetical protein